MYDLQLSTLVIEGAKRAGWIPRHGSWMVATLGAVFAIYGLLQSMAGERVVYVERAPAKVEQTAAPKRVIAREIEKEPKQLRRMLEEAIRERDEALARLSALRPPPQAPAIVTPPIANPIVPQAVPQTAQVEQPQPSKFAGTWIYVPDGKQSPNDLYPAEYIELVLWERDDALLGRYRGRYRVTNRALSPDVEFQFQGVKRGHDRYAWIGNGEAKGEVGLKLVTANSMTVDWFTSQVGRTSCLSSGTAVLVRRIEPGQ